MTIDYSPRDMLHIPIRPGAATSFLEEINVETPERIRMHNGDTFDPRQVVEFALSSELLPRTLRRQDPDFKALVRLGVPGMVVGLVLDVETALATDPGIFANGHSIESLKRLFRGPNLSTGKIAQVATIYGALLGQAPQIKFLPESLIFASRAIRGNGQRYDLYDTQSSKYLLSLVRNHKNETNEATLKGLTLKSLRHLETGLYRRDRAVKAEVKMAARNIAVSTELANALLTAADCKHHGL